VNAEAKEAILKIEADPIIEMVRIEADKEFGRPSPKPPSQGGCGESIEPFRIGCGTGAASRAALGS
jgi:hypothetical protein